MRVSIIPLIVRKLRKALAIVQDTNTATRNIDAGKFVMWNGELCKALSAITTGDTLSSTNLEACTDGGLNVLNSKIKAGLIGTNEMSNITCAGKTMRYKDISFSGFNSPPKVIASIYNNDIAPYGGTNIFITNLTSNSCRIIIDTTISTNLYGCMWLAIEE